MIVENDCIILQVFKIGAGANRRRGTYECDDVDVTDHRQAERETQRVQADREELVERIGRAVREDGTVQPLEGFT